MMFNFILRKLCPIFLISIPFCFGKGPTTYSWAADPSGRAKGQCYEIDTATGGGEFAIKVMHSKCRPAKVESVWFPSENNVGGECYIVDSETKGQKYGRRQRFDKCAPEKSSYRFLQGACFLVDTRTLGGTFNYKVSKSKCRSKTENYRWQLDQNGKRGSCYGYDKNSQSNYRVNKKKCRPKNLVYKWIEGKKRKSKGSCYEIDAEKGREGYFSKVNKKLCLDLKNKTKFWKEKTGECFQLFEDQEGKSIPMKISIEECRPKKTFLQFVKTSSRQGSCFELDTKTLGREFRLRVDKKRCRPSKIRYAVLGRRSHCYEVDSEALETGFINKVPDKLCEKVVDYRWVIDRSGWDGRCFKVSTMAGEEKIGGANDQFCRPKETRYVWAAKDRTNGKCFEIDRINGAKAWSNGVNEKSCRLDENKMKHVFKKDKNKIAGKCYIVDIKTGGLKYSRKVNPEKCRDNLSKRGQFDL